MSVGVAISSTGTRPAMLERAVAMWQNAGIEPVVNYDTEFQGVAATKNRGIRALMAAGVDHLFLADDDVYPLSKFSWTRYVDDPALHLSLSWGKARSEGTVTTHKGDYSAWAWPRGCMLYAHRSVIDRVGGMRTEYGAGGHEHVEWSRRIFQAGLGPSETVMFCDLVQNPRDWWHAEDMIRPGETVHQLRARRRRITTVKRTAADKRRIERLWREHDGLTNFVDYRT